MKKIAAIATSIGLAASSAFAGGIAPVIVEEVPVVETKPTSSVSPLLILGLLILIGVLVSRNNDDGDDTNQEG